MTYQYLQFFYGEVFWKVVSYDRTGFGEVVGHLYVTIFCSGVLYILIFCSKVVDTLLFILILDLDKKLYFSLKPTKNNHSLQGT